MIVVGSAAKHHVGLYTDPEHAEKYQIDEDESPFESYVEFEKVAPLTPTAGQKKGARLCCKKLVGEKKKNVKMIFIEQENVYIIIMIQHHI